MILMYHNVVTEDASSGHRYLSISLRSGAFAAQMKWLKLLFNVVPLSDYMTIWRNKGKVPYRTVALTIDDGTSMTYNAILPVLEKLGLHVTIFVNSCQIDDGPLIWGAYLNALCFEDKYDSVELDGEHYSLSSDALRFSSRKALVSQARATGDPIQTVARWSKLYPLDKDILASYQGMSSDQLSDASKSAHIEIAGHTHNHPFLTDLTEEGQEREILQNLNVLESKTGNRARFFAYPSGDYNETTLELMERLGIEHGFAVHYKKKGDQKYEISRVGVYDPRVWRLLAVIGKSILRC